MNRQVSTIAVGLLVCAGLLIVVPGADATPPDPDHKIMICHVVNGQGELKNGYNLIEVDVASIPAHREHVANDGRRDLIPAPNDQCEAPTPPTTVPPTTVPQSTTTTMAPTTTTTEAPPVSVTVPDDRVETSSIVIVSEDNVEIEIEVAEPAEPVSAEPAFTG